MLPLSSRPRAAWLLLGLALLAPAGCGKEDEGVRHYLAPRVSSDAALAGLNKVRLLAAVVPHESADDFAGPNGDSARAARAPGKAGQPETGR